MAVPPEGYREVPDDDRKKAKVFFDRGVTVAGTGNFDYAIEMYLQGLALDPDSVEGHQSLRDISMRRKAGGGKAIGMLTAMGLARPTKDDKQNMLNYEKLLANDPGNTSHMVGILQNALRAGCYDTILWIGDILQRANADSPKPEYNKFIILKDVYKTLAELTGRADLWRRATDACHYAVQMKPDDMDLQTELKNLGARHTIAKGNYAGDGGFRDSMKDVEGQEKLMEQDKDIRSEDAMTRVLKAAEAEWLKDPNETGKLMKFVETLVKTDSMDHENRAIEILDEAHKRTQQFRFRLTVGQIKMRQLSRMERMFREAVAKNPKDQAAREDYIAFKKDRAEEELREFQLAAEHYPTDLKFRFEAAKRMLELERFGEAIPVLQQARNDPKFRFDAGILLGKAFLDAGFADEAVDTLKQIIDDYQLKGDDKSKEMTYWYARALEEKKDFEPAKKAYSQVAMWDFNYRDCQARIKRLKQGPEAA